MTSSSAAPTRRAPARWRWLFAIVVTTALVAGGIAACGSDEDTPPTAPDGGDAGGGDSAIAPVGDGSTTLLPDGATVSCTDAASAADIDCTGKCGPVREPCSGQIKQCGGCTNAQTADGGDAGPQTCDLTTNTCGAPKVTCAELGAECGTVKNTCGVYLDCPDGVTKGCAAGKECDPDTRKCRDCQPVTCSDLGYECGKVWLGCGPNIPSNLTDCGSCSADADGGARRCNPLSHSCEPACTPKSATELCNAAKEKKGVQCGPISNGCGGSVDCTALVTGFKCKANEGCGLRGISNRCDPLPTPDECVEQGRNCGSITSACTGKSIKCGDCATGQVCNANGVCGSPCEPKTCADYAEFPCGVFDDGCGATLTCACAGGGVCNTATNTCCAPTTCGATYPGKCGDDLPNGCGQTKLDCRCGGGQACTIDGGATASLPLGTSGLCCQPRAASFYTGKGQCGRGLPDGCGRTIDAACPGGGVCVDNATGAPGAEPARGVIGSCCTRTDECAASAPGCASQPNSCRPAETVACGANCTAGSICSDGTCCAGAAACTGGGNDGAVCNTVNAPVDPGCGSSNTCDCTGGRVCWCLGDGGAGSAHACTGADGPGTCKTKLTCSAGYANQCGTALADGVGGTVDCGCGNGRHCTETAAGVAGTCACNTPDGKAFDCTNVPKNGDACGTFDNGCGGSVTCNCPSGQTCNSKANPNVCCTPTACPAGPTVGTACGSLDNGCGGTKSCGCPTGAANANFKCTAGKCACTPDTCRGRTGPQPDLCGGTLQCGG